MNALIIVPIVIGSAAGIIVNYLADVLPRTRRLSKPFCLNCGNMYSTQDYLFMKGCAQCGKRRGARPWIVLFVMIALHLYIWINPPARMNYFICALLTIYLATVFLIDLEHRLILHPTSIFGSLLGLGVGWLNHGLVQTLLGGLAGFVIMLTLYMFGMLFTRIRARRLQKAGQPTDDEEALGAGDVILSTIIGLILGWPLIWFGLLAGILLGGAVSLLLVVWLAVTRRYQENALMIFVPYGPYFIISTSLILFFPDLLVRLVPG